MSRSFLVATSNVHEFLAKSVIELFETAVVIVQGETMPIIKAKDFQRKDRMRTSQFFKNEKMALHKQETEQICQDLRASLAIHSYTQKNGRILELFFHFFQNWNFPVASFEVHSYFRMVALMRRELGRKVLNIARNKMNSTISDITVQLVGKSWAAKFCLLESVPIAIQLYL